MKKELELYIHIPFCVRKCAYCDFLSSSQSDEIIEKYVLSLLDEIRVHATNKNLILNHVVTSVFVGGGTPSILNVTQIQRIFEAVKAVFLFS